MSKQTKLDHAVEVIGQAVHDYMGLTTKENKEAVENVNIVLQSAIDGYLLVQWPESQEYMEEEWFDEEAILALGSEEKTGSSAYFIPIKRVLL